VITRDPRWAYKVLELPIGASASEIRQAYRDLIAVWHPDRFPDNPRRQALGTRKTQEIIEAFALLRDSNTTQHAPPPPHPTSPREKAGDEDRETAGATGERYGPNWDDLNAQWQTAIRLDLCPRCAPPPTLERLARECRCTKCNARFPSPSWPREPAGATGERYGPNWDDLNAQWQAAILRRFCPRCAPPTLLRLARECGCTKCGARFPLIGTEKAKRSTKESGQS
jgi:curved DNA-binding protein CbpA